ncbi:MAG: MarR family transcriptional regulator [Xanthobacteraceae bacterium]|nr:MarR family transcriptional regulator [Xanthobacteraceae bacterium]
MASRRGVDGTKNARRNFSGERSVGLEPEHAKSSLGYQIRYSYRAFVKALAAELNDTGITTSQWSALRVLWQEEGLSQVEIAQRMQVEKASLTSVLAAMEANKLIIREREDMDRRKSIIHLTPAGRELKRRLLPLGEKINARATRGISSSDVRRLNELLSLVTTNLSK